MSDVSLACKQLGVHPSVLSGLTMQKAAELLRDTHRVRARALHTDTTAHKGGDTFFSALSEARASLFDGERALKDLTSILEHNEIGDKIQCAQEAFAEQQVAQQHLATVLVREMLPPQRDNGIDIRLLPTGHFILYDYLACQARDLEWRGRDYSLAADVAREAFRTGKSFVDGQGMEVFSLPNRIRKCPFLAPRMVRESQRKVLGFLYHHDLWGELENISCAQGRSVHSLCMQVAGKESQGLFGTFDTCLYLPENPQVGIFLLTQSFSNSGARYHIEGEVLSFEEQGES